MKTPRFGFLAWTCTVLVIGLLSLSTGRAQNVIAWGDDSYGQADVPASATNVIAVAAGDRHSLGLRSDGTVVCWGSGAGTNIPPDVTNAVAIAAGLWHGAALLADHSVAAWGDNYYQQTNVPATATNVVALAAGDYHTLALRADGTVIAWGQNQYGKTNVPASLSNVVAISAGAQHSMALRSDASVVIWGGGGTAPSYYATNPPPSVIADIVAISAGASHNLGIKAGGGAFTWGYTSDQSTIPSSATNLVAIAAGSSYNLGLSSSGAIIAWGKGAITNVPLTVTNVVAIAGGRAHGLAVIGDGSPRIFGDIAYRTKVSAGDLLPFFARAVGQAPLSYQWTSNGIPLVAPDAALPQIPAVPGNDDAAYQVTVTNTLGGATSTVARVAVRSINLWGRNTEGQCNIPDSVTNPMCIAAGGFHSLALDGSGAVAAWGKNWDGQASVPTAATNAVAIAGGGSHSLALKEDGSVLAWGRNWDGQTNVPVAATNAVALAAGWAHSLALKADGTVVAWGNDVFGQTDVPCLAMNVVAIAAGYYHNIALRSDGVVTTWGWELPVPSDATNVVAVAAGWQHCLALRADGSVIAWGDDTYGESTVPACATNVVAIAAAWYHNLALRGDGTVVAWGRGANGVTNVPPALHNVASIAVGEDYNVAVVGSGAPQFGPQLASVVAHAGGATVLSANVQGPYPLTFQWYHDGNLVAGATNRFLWLPACQAADAGDYVLVAANSFGQATNQPVNLAVHPDPVAITAVGAWGDNISGQCAVSHGVANPRAIAAGAFHALAMNWDGTVAAWGKNRDGQTNVPPAATNVLAVAAGGSHSLALRGDGSVVGWGGNSDGQTNVPPTATNVVAIAAGWTHSLALNADGSVLAWGDNAFHQTDVPSFAAGAIAIAAGYYHNLALLSNHTVVAWGLQNVVPASATNVVAISGGWWHSLALRADGSVVAWGDNSYGQCNVPAAATNVVGIAAGYSHSLLLLADGTVLAWGSGAYGATNVPTGFGNVARIAAGQDYSLVMVEQGPPRFGSGPTALVSHAGGKVTLGAEVSGTSPLAFQWFHDGASIEGATSRYLVMTNVPLSDSGTYTLVARNPTGLTNSLAWGLDVQSAPAVAGNPMLQNVLVGSHVCLNAEVSGLEPISLQWRLNGVDLQDGPRITGATSTALCLDNAQSQDSGIYSLVASNANGSVTGVVAQISVSPIIAWGDNSAQQCSVPLGTVDVASIAAGGEHSLALRADHSIVAWGDASSGQNNVPQSDGDIVAIADGGAHSLALRSNGSGLVWGNQIFYPGYRENSFSFPQPVVAMAAGGSYSLVLLLDGTVISWGTNRFDDRPVPSSATNLVAVAAGDDFSLGVRSDATLVSWGALTVVPDAATNIVAIAAGGRHALALRTDGVLIAWGGNYFGQTSVPDYVTNVVGIAAGGDNSLALLADGRVVGWGADYYGQASAPESATNVLAISAGAGHFLALVGEGTRGSILQPVNQTGTIGQSVRLNAGSLQGNLASYQWQLNGIDLPGATNAALLIPFATWTNAGLYRVLASNVLGSVTGPPIMLTVLRTPLYFDTSPGGILLSNDGTHLRVLGASGVGPVVILASGDLQAWEPILTNPPVIGTVEFIDSETGNPLGRFYRAMEGAVAGPLRIGIQPSLAPMGSATLPLQLTGLTANGPVIIYASSNLLDWSAIFTNPPTVGPLQYQEAPASGQPLRFYRASETR